MTQRPMFPVSMMLTIFLGAICIFGVFALLARLTPVIESAAERQSQFLLHLPDGYVDFAILISAAVSLFLELAMIRRQVSCYEVLAFYKNYSLLGCFAGLGVGYALGNRKWLPLFLTVPLLGWQFALLLGLRYGLADADRISLKFVPFSEQLSMGLPTAANAGFGLPTNYLLALIFLLTALAFLPVGQLCGCLLERREKLSGYSINLNGSVLGILLMFCLSAFWTPPTIWFLLAFTPLLLFQRMECSCTCIWPYLCGALDLDSGMASQSRVAAYLLTVSTA